MHFHLEIILPPTDDVEEAIKTILAPFDEQGEDEDGNPNSHVFWDWFVVGGRMAGNKFLAALEQRKLDEFYQWCDAEKVTVAGLQAGKQELKPETQIPKVDAKWNELFPENNGKACPLFNHSNNQYDSQSLINGDICLVKDIPSELKAERLIIAAPSYSSTTKDYTGDLEATFMISQDFYNGVNYVNTTWKGNVLKGLQLAKKKFKQYAPEYKERVTPKDDWVCVTVDYHS